MIITLKQVTRCIKKAAMKLSENELRRTQFAYFLGRNVTVVTNATALPLHGETGHLLHHKTFGGVCEGFDEWGVWLIDPTTNAKSFFFFKEIQGFVENPALPADHPLVREAIQRSQAQATVTKGKEIMESLGDLSVEAFQKVLKEQTKK